jgi:hypothetical protein
MPVMEPPSYLEQVEGMFLAAVRRCLALRPADVDVVRDWERRGVPVEAVRRGIAEGKERFLKTAEPHAPLPSVLKYYRTFVEAEFQAHQRRVFRGSIVGDPGAVPVEPAADPVLRARAVLEAWRDAAPSDAARALPTAALKRLDGPTDSPGAERIAAADEALQQAALAVAPAEARERVKARVARAVADARRRGMGAVAVADVQASETRAALRDELGIASLADAVASQVPAGGMP